MTGKKTRSQIHYWVITPNTLTFLRVILTCYVHYYLLVHFGGLTIPLCVTGIIFLTDYLDGKIARREGTVTPGGAVFDLLADFFYMLQAYLVLYSFCLIPCWFLFLVLLKFVEYVLTSFFLRKSGSSKAMFTFDLIGRFVAGLFYIFPILLYVAYWSSPVFYNFCISKLTYSILFLSLLSSVYRIRNCGR